MLLSASQTRVCGVSGACGGMGRTRPAWRDARCARRQRPASLADAADAASAGPSGAALVLLPAAAVVAGAAGLRFFLYSQLEYITASMLTRYVPKGDGGARVIQLGGGTKELFYYPKDTVSVTAVGTAFNKGLMEQAGVQAGVPTVVRSQSPGDLGFAADGSVDAVVALGALGRMAAPQRRAALAEAARVLKPGRPLVFIERLAEGGSPLRALLGGDEGALPLAEFEALRDAGAGLWEYVQWDVALEGQDPRTVGVAVRGKAGATRRQPAARPPPRAKGFN